MKKILAILMVLALVFCTFAACGKKEGSSSLKIGLICFHDENSTYDNNFIQAMKEVQKELNLSDEQVLIKMNIPESDACYTAAAELADAGCNIVFADSFGHESYMLQAAKEFKDVYDGTICWCSHSVPQLLIARLTPDVKVEINAGLFDEDFYIPMFWILKYLATRRTKYSDRYYMNFYPTVLSENRTYRKIKDIDSEQIPKTLFEEEDVKFRKFNIDLTPNVNIDIVLKTIHERLLKVKEEK